MSKRSRKKIPTETPTTTVTHLSHEGRGIAHVEGKTTFLFGALANETVQFRYTHCHKQFDEGAAIEIIAASPDRVTPRCAHFGVCGGCALQHYSPSAQRLHKQTVLLEHFQHQAQCAPKEILAPLEGDTWGYRRRARLSVRYVLKKNKVLVGFRERQSSFVADIHQCETLHPSIGHKIEAFSTLLMQLSTKSDIPQIEVSIGDNASAIIIRHLVALPENDLEQIIHFVKQHDLQCYLQPNGADSVHPLYPENPDTLYYDVPAQQVRLYFQPSQFTQINSSINLKMIARAIELLDLKKTDHVLDLFCGIGNFSLPIATLCEKVVGVEGSDAAISQAKTNAEKNAIQNAEFYTQDLSIDLDAPWSKNQYDKILLDPARIGAAEIMKYIPNWKPSRIVYVSCNPITLARDTKALLEMGYTLEKAGVMDMFPHTEHVEAIALFLNL